MGIIGLKIILQRISKKEGIRSSDIDNKILSYVNIKQFNGKIIGIDASNLLYKLLYFDSKEIKDKDNYINSFYGLVCFFKKFGVIPVFVFDGVPPKEKQKTIDKRNTTRAKAKEKMEEMYNDITKYCEEKNIKFDIELLRNADYLINSDDFTDKVNDDSTLKELLKKAVAYKKKSYQSLFVSKLMVKKIKLLLKICNVPFVHLDLEADYVLAKLYKDNIIDAVISNDRDMLVYGINTLLINFNVFNGNSNLFSLKNILSLLKLTFSEFVDFCILSGTDYCKIKGIGPIIAYDLIKKYSKIENIIEELSYKYDFSNFNYEHIRKMFSCNSFKCNYLKKDKIIDDGNINDNNNKDNNDDKNNKNNKNNNDKDDNNGGGDNDDKKNNNSKKNEDDNDKDYNKNNTNSIGNHKQKNKFRTYSYFIDKLIENKKNNEIMNIDKKLLSKYSKQFNIKFTKR